MTDSNSSNSEPGHQGAKSTLAATLEFFCRHLIGIGWYEGTVDERGEFIEQPTFCGASGFLLQLHDDQPNSCFLITAGHVFTDYEERMSDPTIGAKCHSIFDIWGPHSRCDLRIPLNLFENRALVTFDKQLGVDFALVSLPDLVLRALRETTKPFTRSDWIHQHNVTFDSHAMLGLPDEDAERIINYKEGIESITTFQNPSLVDLQPCELPPSITLARNPQFVARINPRADLNSIVGMSGGPILGFSRTGDGKLRYWPVAIQSRWLPQSRIVIGTLVASIASEIEQKMEELLEERPT